MNIRCGPLLLVCRIIASCLKELLQQPQGLAVAETPRRLLVSWHSVLIVGTPARQAM